MKKPLTGFHVAMMFIAGFGIVIGVNFYMAYLAIDGFSGVVVKNSYVASQNFNQWLDEAERQEQLEWRATVHQDAQGHIIVVTQGLPDKAQVSAAIRRPLGQVEASQLTFQHRANGEYASLQSVAQGRWIIRLTVTADGERWKQETQIK